MSRASRKRSKSRPADGGGGKTYVLQVKVSPDQRETIRRKAEGLSLPMATWARQTLLREAEILPGLEVAAKTVVMAASRRRGRRAAARVSDS